MFELGVELLVDCVTKIRSDTLEESFPNVPTRAYPLPLLFLAFARVGGGCVVNRAVVGVGFRFFDISVDAGLMVVVVDS